MYNYYLLKTIDVFVIAVYALGSDVSRVATSVTTSVTTVMTTVMISSAKSVSIGSKGHNDCTRISLKSLVVITLILHRSIGSFET